MLPIPVTIMSSYVNFVLINYQTMITPPNE